MVEEKCGENIMKRIVRFLVTPTIVIFLLGILWYSARWVENIGMNIKDLKEKYEDLDVRISQFEPVSYTDSDESTEISESEQEKEIMGSCGHMNPDIITTESRTSYGMRYYLDYNICELNENYNWEKLGKFPDPGIFYKVTSDFKKMSTWCMSVGTFKKDDANLNRIFIISRKVANELGILEDSLENISVRVSLMEEDEWKSRKECIDLYNLLEIDEMKTNF